MNLHQQGWQHDYGMQQLTSHEMLPQVQHAVNVLLQSPVKCRQLCGPLVGAMNGAKRGYLHISAGRPVIA